MHGRWRQGDEVSPDMKARAEELKRQIAEHQASAAASQAKMLGQQQLAAATAREQELKVAKAAETAAAADYDAKIKDWAAKQAAQAQEELSRGPLDEKRKLHEAESAKLAAMNLELDQLAAAVKDAIEPLPPVAENIHASVEDPPRLVHRRGGRGSGADLRRIDAPHGPGGWARGNAVA